MEIQVTWENYIFVMPKETVVNDRCCCTTNSSSAKAKAPCTSPSPCNNIKLSSIHKQKKKVRFDRENLVQILEFEDDDESKDCRKRYWEFFAIDRAHFLNRIMNHEERLNLILTPKHRENVYQQRFLDKL